MSHIPKGVAKAEESIQILNRFHDIVWIEMQPHDERAGKVVVYVHGQYHVYGFGPYSKAEFWDAVFYVRELMRSKLLWICCND